MTGKSKFVYDAEDVAGLLVIPAEGFPPPVEPRSLADPRMLAYRKMLSDRPHMAPLNTMVEDLRAMGRGTVPDFDPMDGGVNARLLFLLEKPGPMTDPNRPKKKKGSGFISRDNDDATAAATFQFMQQARLAREETVIWNAIPWWNGRIEIEAEEWRAGLAQLNRLIDLLPNLQGVVLIGRKAERARPLIEERRLPVWHSAHPSPRVRSIYPQLYAAIPGVWIRAARNTGRRQGS